MELIQLLTRRMILCASRSETWKLVVSALSLTAVCNNQDTPYRTTYPVINWSETVGKIKHASQPDKNDPPEPLAALCAFAQQNDTIAVGAATVEINLVNCPKAQISIWRVYEMKFSEHVRLFNWTVLCESTELADALRRASEILARRRQK